LEKLGLVSPTNEEQLTPEKGGPPDGLVKVLIGFKEKPGPPEQALVKGLGGKIKYTYNIIPAIAASVPEVAINALQKNPNVTNVELDSMVYALDTELDNSWGVKRIGAGIVHDSGNNGDGIKIAIIDTGIDEDHPDLDGNLVGGVNFVSKPSWRTPDPNKWDDDNGHGTHVAGIIAAEDNNIGVVGVAPGADLYALKVLDRTGSGYVSDVVMAIQWATVNEIQVINMSLGGAYDIWLDGACLLAYVEGLILVAAAGNGGSVIYPAAYDSVIAVSATNSADELAYFSSTGPEVELAAPGEDIYSTYKGGGYATLSGTSMASPHVAGVAALVIASGISDVMGVRTKLQETADDLGATGRDSKYGYGLVDADEAALESVDIHDVAVTAISALSWVLQGDMVNVDVDVANEGTFEEAFNVVLTESPDGFSDTKTITLAAGASTTISFSWQTSTSTTLDNHALMATASPVTDETDIDDNSKSTTVLVKEAVANTMYVEIITFSSKVAGPNKFLYTTVKVVDGGGSALEGAGVVITLDWDKEGDETIDDSWNFAGDTDVDGMVKFTLKKAPSGSYTAIVTGLTLTGYNWNKDEGKISADYPLQ
jgi:subtilisin